LTARRCPSWFYPWSTFTNSPYWNTFSDILFCLKYLHIKMKIYSSFVASQLIMYVHTYKAKSFLKFDNIFKLSILSALWNLTKRVAREEFKHDRLLSHHCQRTKQGLMETCDDSARWPWSHYSALLTANLGIRIYFSPGIWWIYIKKNIYIYIFIYIYRYRHLHRQQVHRRRHVQFRHHPYCTIMSTNRLS
jgi:hypothetical protein